MELVKKKLWLNQDKYIQCVFEKFNMIDCKEYGFICQHISNFPHVNIQPMSLKRKR